MARSFDLARRSGEMAEMARARCVREAAFMVVLVQTGTEFEDDAIVNVLENLAAVAKEYYASPDEVQQALEVHEPTLAIPDL